MVINIEIYRGSVNIENKRVDINKIIGLAFGLGLFKKMLNENLINENEFENMTREFKKDMRGENIK